MERRSSSGYLEFELPPVDNPFGVRKGHNLGEYHYVVNSDVVDAQAISLPARFWSNGFFTSYAPPLQFHPEVRGETC